MFPCRSHGPALMWYNCHTTLQCDSGLIFEIREDNLGEYCHLVTLWRSTREERELYEANS